MSGPFKLKYNNSAFPFKEEEKKPNLNMIANIIGFENIKRVEDEIGPPDKLGDWSDEEKAQLQHALNKLKSTRKKYPIKDYSHKKDEYKVK